MSTEPIYIDRAVGSADLAPLLERIGLPVYRNEDGSLPGLEYADVEFTGRGVEGEPLLIGVEVKRLTELTGDWDRFAGVQVPKMQAPTYAHRWLVYEGEWVKDKKSGLLMRWAGKRGRKPLHGQSNALALRKKLLTLEMCAGFHKERTYNRDETVDFLQALYRFWTDDDLDKHRSHIVMYEPLHSWGTPSTLRRIAAVLPGIGTEKSKAVENHFKTITHMVNASEQEWMKIEGVGKKLASGLVNVCRGL